MSNGHNAAIVRSAAALVLAALLAACGGTASSGPSGSAPPSHSGQGTASAAAAPAAGPSGLPCHPQDSSCWLPETAPYPQEEFISYKPAHGYASAYALAKVLGCSVMAPIGAYTPSATAVNCNSGPAAGVTVSTPQAVANIAANVASNAESTANDAYAVIGPGWVAAGADNNYQSAAQIQDLAGGELTCFSDGTTVDGIRPCSDPSSAGAVPTPSVSAGPEACPSAPASYDSGQKLVFNGACSTWLNQVQTEIQENGGEPGKAAADWCTTYDEGAPGTTDTPAQLMPACRAGIAAAGGPAVNAS